MNKYFAQKNPDYIFVASLIAIIIVAVYLALDRFENKNISSYLLKTGQNLLSQIDNRQERQNLEANYKEFLEKVNDREIDPAKVEQFVSSMINLNQAKEKIDKDTFKHIFETTLKDVSKPDSIKKYYSENDERWTSLQKRLKDLNSFEEKINIIVKKVPELKNNNNFSYAVDDTLNIVINENLKDDLKKLKEIDLTKELRQLEKEKILKWQKQVQVIKADQNDLKQDLLKLSKADSVMKVFQYNNDSLLTPETPSTPATPSSPATQAKTSEAKVNH